MNARKQQRATLLHRGPCVLLAAANDAAAEGESTAPKPRWLEVAYTGRFKGHWMGEFEFTRQTFEQIVANLQKHPAYVSGAEQAPPEDIESGKFDVVQFDFHHASEMPPTDGDIAVHGAPAQGWVLDGKIQDGEDGKAHLWVYARFLEPANTYLAEKRYKWVSVSVDFNGTDPVSAEPVGAVLTSIALTNHPFLQDLPPIAAARNLSGYYYGDAAMTPEEAFEAIRRCLGLPETADAAAVASEVVKLKQWTVHGVKPPAGVDPDESLAKFRAILALPILSTEEDVFNELDKLFARMLGTTNSPAEGTMAAQRQETTMTTNAPQGADLRAQLAQCLSTRLKVDAAAITDTKILLQVEQGMDGMENLAALLESLGASNVREALGKVAESKKIADAFAALLPQHDAMKSKVDEMQTKVDGYETADAEQDVEMAMASQGWDPKDPAKSALHKLLMKSRKDGKAAFREQWGITDEATRQADAARAHLTTSIATQRQTGDRGAIGPLGTLAISGGRVVASSDNRAQKPLLSDGRPNTDSADISDLPGANIYQKAEAFVLSQAPATAYDDVHRTARALVNNHKVHVRDAA